MTKIDLKISYNDLVKNFKNLHVVWLFFKKEIGK